MTRDGGGRKIRGPKTDRAAASPSPAPFPIDAQVPALSSADTQLCPHMSFAATPPTIYGTLARYYVLPADLCHPIPDAVSFEDGAMIEPLSVGVHSVATLGKCKSNQVVVIFGCGPVGLLCMAVAKALGARKIVAVDINQERLDFAKSYAATDIAIPVCRPSLPWPALTSGRKEPGRGLRRLCRAGI